MTMKKQILILIAPLFLADSAAAEEPSKLWTLEECIQYALSHNIDLKQREQEQKSREVELHSSRFSWLPDLNANIGQNFDFGCRPKLVQLLRGRFALDAGLRRASDSQ